MSNKRCNCTDVCFKHQNVSYEKLIEMGLICEPCIINYREFLKD